MRISGESRTTGVPFETVLAAAQSGAGWASTTLWREYSASVVGFARGRGARDPDDLASEVFLAVFDQLATFSGSEPEFRSFIFSIAYRRLVDELRQRERRGEAVEWVPEHDIRWQPSAEDTASERFSDASVLALFDELPADQRDVMTLRFVSDLTVEQIAEVLGKRPGAVKALQRRALDRLRKKFRRSRTLLPPSNDYQCEMTTTRISDRDALELANGRVPARADLNEVADLLTEYRRAALGSAPRPSAALTARLDLSSTPIAMQRDGLAVGRSGVTGRRAASGLFGLGLTVTIILGAASGAAAVVGAGTAGLLPLGTQDAFDQVVSTFVSPGVAGQETTDDGEAPGAAVPDKSSGTDESEHAVVPAVTPSPTPHNDDNGKSEDSSGKAGTDDSGSNSNGTPNNSGNGNSENSNGNAGSGSSNSESSGNSGKSEKSEKPEKSENGNSGKSDDDSDDD